MAKRRNRIVHQADLPSRIATISEAWGVVDEWQLIMWLLAVPAFYYQLRVSIGAANVIERTMYDRFTQAMLSHVDFGNQLRTIPRIPPELHIEAFQKAAATLKDIGTTLKLDVSELILNQK